MGREFSQFDRRQYPTVGILEGYRAWAPLYDEMVPGLIDMPMLNAIDCVDWKNVRACADLACGTGRIGRWLKETKQIAAIDGVDLSPDMLTFAREKKIYRTLIQNDLAKTGLTAASYDLTICVLAACHVEDLDAFYAESRRLLKPGGRAILVDFHPFFLLNGIPTHFPQADGKGPLAIKNVVHLFSDHFQSAQRAGFQLLDLRERVVDEAWVKESPSFGPYLQRPVGFTMVFEA
jgi:SAM-dependent methyltransferase